MAKMTVVGIDDLENAFINIADIPFEVTAEALSQMADVAAGEIKRSGESMGVRDPKSDVHILDNVEPGTPKKTHGGGTCAISFSGSRKRGKKNTRNAEIAFINEFGKPGQPARPFVRKGMEQGTEKIVQAGQKVIAAWIEEEFNKK